MRGRFASWRNTWSRCAGSRRRTSRIRSCSSGRRGCRAAAGAARPDAAAQTEARPSKADQRPRSSAAGRRSNGRATTRTHASSPKAHDLEPVARRPTPPLRRLLGRRPRHHGGGQPRRASKPAARSIGLNIRLPFEQAPNRYITEGLHLRVPLLLHAEVLVRLPGEGAGRLPRRVRHAGRDVRDPDAGADRQALEEAARDPLRRRSTGTKSSTWNRWRSGGRSTKRISKLLCRVDSVPEAFEELKRHLTKHHMVPETRQETKAPGIAKTRG